MVKESFLQFEDHYLFDTLWKADSIGIQPLNVILPIAA